MEGDNPSGKPPVTPLPDALQRTLERTPYRYMGGYNTWYVCVLEDDWDRIVAHLVAVPADARGERAVIDAAKEWACHEEMARDHERSGRMILTTEYNDKLLAAVDALDAHQRGGTDLHG